jgi:hypothetical protein
MTAKVYCRQCIMDCTGVCAALKVNAQPAGLSNQQLSSAGTPSPPTPSATTHAVRSYRELPARYRRKPLDQVEIDYIQVSH